ncbi:pentapeptide repeat-containing protein [Morganella morganii]|uniref:pentapeptide repeat-containing protein n=1 Tax=Morganella morganii TaxID=582 RepID=UPI0034D624BE
MPIVIGVVDKATRVTKKASTSVKDGVNVLKAVPGVDYVLVDKQTGAAPQKVIMIRDGNNLKLFLMGEEDPSVVIEDYYLVPGQIIGESADKQVHDYTPQSAVEHDNIGSMADKQAAVQQPGEKLLAPITWESSGPGWELLTFLGLAVAGGTAAVIAKNNNSDDDHKNNDSSADNKDNGNTNAGEKDNGNTAADDTGNGNAGTDDKGNSNAGTENSGNGNTGTDDKGNGNTGTENTGTETGGNSHTGADDQGNNNTGTNDNDNGSTAPDDQENTDVPADITAIAAIDDVADSAEFDPENLSAMTPVLSGHPDHALPGSEDAAALAATGLLSGHEGSVNLDKLLSQLPEQDTPAENYNAAVSTPDYLQPSAEFTAHEMVHPELASLTETQTSLF